MNIYFHESSYFRSYFYCVWPDVTSLFTYIGAFSCKWSLFDWNVKFSSGKNWQFLVANVWLWKRMRKRPKIECHLSFSSSLLVQQHQLRWVATEIFGISTQMTLTMNSTLTGQVTDRRTSKKRRSPPQWKNTSTGQSTKYCTGWGRNMHTFICTFWVNILLKEKWQKLKFLM